MSTEFSKIITIIESLTDVEDPDVIFTALVDYAATQGLENIFLGRLTPAASAQDLINDFYRTTYPEAWITQYLTKDYVNVDPVVDHILASTRPFRYEDAYQDLTSAQTAFMRDAQSYNMNYGFIIPIHQRGQAPGSVVFASQTPFTFDASAELALELLARVTFQRVERHFMTRPEMALIRLNDRERQILPLVAQGKTNWEIAKIIDLSEFSVRDYLQDLSRRLNTNNRTHTVARAIQLGLLTL